MITCSWGIFAYNEENNIGALLDAAVNQSLKTVTIKEIIVVSSASTDQTDSIVQKYVEKYPYIRLITESERRGKSAAINVFLAEATGDICLIESADTIPDSTTVEYMVAPFENACIGMTGGRPMPVNNPHSFIGFAVHFLWRLHHRMALISPKLGEMVAFRNIVTEIPEKSPVDEASIEAIIRNNNLEKCYIPEAIVHNKGPEHATDFLKQRRRIYAGHLWLQKHQKYRVITQNSGLIIRMTLHELSWNPIKNIKIFYTVFLEVYGRFLGWIDYKILKKIPYKWDIATTTKNLGHVDRK